MAETTATANATAKKAPRKAVKKAAPKKAAASKAPAKRTAKPASDEFAVIETGGKQHVVAVGDTIKIEKLPGEYEEGKKIVFDKVLLVDNGTEATIGTPYISGAKVEGILEEVGRAKKINVIKFKSKSRYFKKRGHRQPFFKVKIAALK